MRYEPVSEGWSYTITLPPNEARCEDQTRRWNIGSRCPFRARLTRSDGLHVCRIHAVRVVVPDVFVKAFDP